MREPRKLVSIPPRLPPGVPVSRGTGEGVEDRISAYLSGGGLWNPELANHDAVRDLLIDARAEVQRLRGVVEELRALVRHAAAQAETDEEERDILRRYDAITIPNPEVADGA